MRPDIGPNRCNECFGAQPNPTNDPPVQKVNLVLPGNAASAQAEAVKELYEKPPTLTDPTAQKVVEAAQRYAQAREAVKIIQEQLRDARELVAALEKQLKGNQDLEEAAQAELREATTKK